MVNEGLSSGSEVLFADSDSMGVADSYQAEDDNPNDR
jgi:hypothetical protein